MEQHPMPALRSPGEPKVDSREAETTAISFRKKSPSKRARDLNRARSHAEDIRTSKQSLNSTSQPVKEPRKCPFRAARRFCGALSRIILGICLGNDATLDRNTHADETPKPSEQATNNSGSADQIGTLYKDLETAIRLSRLESQEHLLPALRIIVRRFHPHGDRICFPIPGTVDEMTLRCVDIPTEPHALLHLVTVIYDRRNLDLDLEEIQRGFAKAHGCIYLDPRKSWPECFGVSRCPQ